MLLAIRKASEGVAAHLQPDEELAASTQWRRAVTCRHHARSAQGSGPERRAEATSRLHQQGVSSQTCRASSQAQHMGGTCSLAGHAPYTG